MSVTLLQGDALALPLAAESVDLIVTSPPYFGLRSYTDDGEHYAGQLGSEPTPGEFLDALVAATAEMVRVLKPTGSIFVNLGDKYARPGGGFDVAGRNRNLDRAGRGSSQRLPTPTAAAGGIREKSLMGLPWRYALRCIGHGTALADPQVVRLLLRDVALGVLTLADAERIVDELAATPDPGLGLILRAEVIWSKPNGLPESVTDRVRRSHEQWFHFVKSPRYYAAVDEIREPHTGNSHPAGPRATVTSWQSGNGQRHRTGRSDLELFNPLGKLPGSVEVLDDDPPLTIPPAVLATLTGRDSATVWSVATQPLTVPPGLGVDHFAAFPMEWPRRIIRGWSPSGICTACGEGRRPRLARGPSYLSEHPMPHPTEPGGDIRKQRAKGQKHQDWKDAHPDRIVGEQCACPEPTAPTRPAVVLDPFGGTGTVALVADVLGRHGISHDRSRDYCRIAEWRTADPAQRASALQVEKPPPVPFGMESLFDLIQDGAP